jgi:ketosteroid isomerase-like protein
MSHQNVQLVRAAIDAIRGGDVEAALSYFSEDVVWYPLVAGPYHGREGIVKQWAVWIEEFDEYWFKAGDVMDAGDEVVLIWRHGGVGRSSGIAIEDDGATLFGIENGQISTARVYSARDEALEAAGLRE